MKREFDKNLPSSIRHAPVIHDSLPQNRGCFATAKPLSPSGGVVRPRPALCDPGHLPLRHDQRRDPARGRGALRCGRGGWLGALMWGGFKVGVHGGNLVI